MVQCGIADHLSAFLRSKNVSFRIISLSKNFIPRSRDFGLQTGSVYRQVVDELARHGQQQDLQAFRRQSGMQTTTADVLSINDSGRIISGRDVGYKRRDLRM